MEFEKKAKIMEFQNIHMEKSWKKILVLRAFHPILTHHLAYYECSNFDHKCCIIIMAIRRCNETPLKAQ